MICTGSVYSCCRMILWRRSRVYEFHSLSSTSLQCGWEIKALVFKRLLAKHLLSLRWGDTSGAIQYCCSSKCPTKWFQTLDLFFSPVYLSGDWNDCLKQDNGERGTVLMWLSRAAPYGLCARWSQRAPAAEIPARPSKAIWGLRENATISITHTCAFRALVSDFGHFQKISKSLKKSSKTKKKKPFQCEIFKLSYTATSHTKTCAFMLKECR